MQNAFPFQLEDIQSWIIRRKDGTVVKYTMITAEQAAKQLGTSGGAHEKKAPTYYANYPHYSAWCDHAPWPQGIEGRPAKTNERPPVFSDGKISLWIADAPGARLVNGAFDVCIDGGNALDVSGERDLPDIYGDPKLKAALERFTMREIEAKEKKATGGPRVIKLRWYDRAAPPVVPAFWPALLKELYKLQEKTAPEPLRVLTICQGGHGRSGSALVALMMCMTDYTPLDALIHIRGLHCARAIESRVQHDYLNHLAAYLGRAENALEAEKVSSYKDALSVGAQFAEVYKLQLAAGKGAGDRERDERL